MGFVLGGPASYFLSKMNRMIAAAPTDAKIRTMIKGSAEGLRPPPAGSGFALGLTGGGAGAVGGASTGVSMRVKSLGPAARGAGALEGTGGGAYGSTRSPASFA